MSRMIIVDPALRSLVGHHFHLNLALSEHARAVGLSPLVLASTHLADRRVSFHLDTTPIFHLCQYEGLDRPTVLGEINDYFGQVFDHALGDVGDGDIVIFHTATPATILAIGRWVRANLPHRRFGVVVVCNVGYFLIPELAPYYAEFLALVAGQDGARLKIWAEHADAAAALGGLAAGQVPIEPLPFMFPAALDQIAHRPPSSGPVVVCHQGHSRYERGSHLLEPIAARVLKQRGEGVAFSFQINPEQASWPAEALVELRRSVDAMHGDSRIDLHVGELSSEDYYERLGRSRLVLLPYTGTYLRTSSGLFAEALAARRPMVLPADSYIAREAERVGAGFVTFSQWNPVAIADATVAAIDDIVRLEARAATAARHVHDDDGIEAFLGRLLAAL